MSYYFVTTRSGGTQLHEARTQAELHRLLNHYKDVEPVQWATARRWVRAGGLHNTALYVMDGCVRRAQEERDR